MASKVSVDNVGELRSFASQLEGLKIQQPDGTITDVKKKQ